MRCEKNDKDGGDKGAVSSSDAVESRCFQAPACRVSICAHEVVELVHQTLNEACTSGEASAKVLYQTARDLFFLFRTVVPTLYSEAIANDPQACMLYHNDCIYIAYHMLVIGQRYNHR